VNVPIQYHAVLIHGGGETAIELTERGWRARPEMETLKGFRLFPIYGCENLPSVYVDLAPLPDGTPKRLIYFSRAFGQLSGQQILDAATGQPLPAGPLLRLYCVGWQASLEGQNVQSKLWIYPNGLVVAAEEPPFVQEIMEKLLRGETWP
jgi:hypothetical protein